MREFAGGDVLSTGICTWNGGVRCGRFVRVADGWCLEVENAAGDEFEASGVNGVLKARAQEPLDVVFQGIVDAAAKYGRAVDDQSILMVRRATSN